MEKEASKRERIIDAAIEVFCAAGYDAASMADVAAKAGVAKGTLYLYFESKQCLFEEAYRLCHAERVRECSANTEAIPGILDKLCLRLRNGTRWELASPLKNQLVRVYLAHPHFREKVKNKVVDRCTDSVEALVAQGAASGELRDMPPALLEEMYVRFGSAVYYYMADHPEQAENEALWENICASLHGCLGAK